MEAAGGAERLSGTGGSARSLAQLFRSDSSSLHRAVNISIDSLCCFTCKSSSLSFILAKSLSTVRFSFSNAAGSVAKVGFLTFLIPDAFSVVAFVETVEVEVGFVDTRTAVVVTGAADKSETDVGTGDEDVTPVKEDNVDTGK